MRIIIVKKFIKKLLKLAGFNNLVDFYQGLKMLSLKRAVAQQKLYEMITRLREIEPDISNQESRKKGNFNDYMEFKRRALQSFQCFLMLRALEYYNTEMLTVVDIGDSAGTHMLYLKELTRGKYRIDTVSVNLDPRAIEKIKARGQKAILARAEELYMGEKQVDLFISFQMVEHLHDPALFFRRLAKKSQCNRFVITVPYLKMSRVGLHYTQSDTNEIFFAEDEHIFELSPRDWTLLMLHAGWRVMYSKIYYQYPKKWPIISTLLASHWRKTDFEGFWGAILEKDTTISDLYQDWKD